MTLQYTIQLPFYCNEAWVDSNCLNVSLKFKLIISSLMFDIIVNFLSAVPEPEPEAAPSPEPEAAPTAEPEAAPSLEEPSPAAPEAEAAAPTETSEPPPGCLHTFLYSYMRV